MGERRVSDERNELAINTGMLYGSLQDWTQDLRSEREENRRLRVSTIEDCIRIAKDHRPDFPNSEWDDAAQSAINWLIDDLQALAERDDGGESRV